MAADLGPFMGTEKFCVAGSMGREVGNRADQGHAPPSMGQDLARHPHPTLLVKRVSTGRMLFSSLRAGDKFQLCYIIWPKPFNSEGQNWRWEASALHGT